AASAAAAIAALRPALEVRLERAGLLPLFRDVEMPLLEVLVAMESEGVRVDAGALGAFARDLQTRVDAIAESIFRCAGTRFNVQSPRQRGNVLFEVLRLAGGRRTQSGWSPDVDVLERLAGEHEIARLLLEHRQLAKLRSTYAEALPRLVDARTGRIHTRFN